MTIHRRVIGFFGTLAVMLTLAGFIFMLGMVIADVILTALEGVQP